VCEERKRREPELGGKWKEKWKGKGREGKGREVGRLL